MTPRGIGIVTALSVASCLTAAIAIAQSSPRSVKSKLIVGLSRKKINFGKEPAGTQSSPQMVTLTNKGSADLAAPVVSVSGPGFSLDTNGCTSAIAPLGSCPVSVFFTPPKKGKFKGLLKFSDGAAHSPQKVKLSGIGGPSLPPSATATPTATATATKTATPTTTATATPTATPSPGVNVVFVTSLTYDGSINGAMGLAGADTACQTLAENAHLPAGTYKALLSTSTVNAVDRLGAARAFVRVDGAPIADTVFDLASGKILNPIDLDESGKDQRFPEDSDVWTGSTSAGTVSSGNTCDDWTSTSHSIFGENGYFDGGPMAWSGTGGFDCGDGAQLHLYCFDTSHAEQLSYTPVSGRIAFVSKTDFDPSSGIAMADQICQNEATGAGLANAKSYLALLSTSTASAASRFDMSMGSMPFVRPDGIKIADAPALATGTIDSDMWQYADGTYFTGFDHFTSTGSAAPNTTGSLSDTCNDWSSNASTEIIGNSTETAIWWDELSGISCASRPVFCLEP